MLDGLARVFLAEALVVPTGLLTVAYLTHRFDPSDYGLYTLAVTLVVWLEWGFSAPVARAAARLIGGATDWRPVATLIVRTQLVAGVTLGLFLVLAAPLIAAAFGEPRLTAVLRLFAVELPLFALAQAHQQILVGLGRFRERAVLSAGRWTARLTLILVAVEAGLSVEGAVLGNIGASLVELAVARRFVRPPMFGRCGVPVRQLFGYAVPLLLSSLCLRVFDRMDVVLLKVLGGSTADVGVYGAAQNLTLVTGLFSISFAPLLLATVTRAILGGDLAYARQLARDSMRFVVLLLPLAAIMAASAGEIVELLFGARFLPGTRVFQLLIFAGVANVAISVAGAILTGAGRPSWTIAIAAPLPFAAALAHLWAIPRYGSIGAAMVTMLGATAGAMVGFAAIHRLWRTAPPLQSVLRSGLLTTAAAAASAAWVAPGLMLVPKLGVLCFGTVAVLLVSGEFGSPRLLLHHACRAIQAHV